MGDATVASVENKLEDLSGLVLRPGENPYAALINACNDDPVSVLFLRTLADFADLAQREIQALYSAHRTRRNAQQREKFIDTGFKELAFDQYLLQLEDRSIKPAFRDPRNCLVLWARPPEHVIQLAARLQQLLKEKAPGKPHALPISLQNGEGD